MPGTTDRPSSRTYLPRRTILAAGLLLPATARARSDRALLHVDDFDHGLSNWQVECEQPGRIEARGGALDIDVPAGVTLWFRPVLTGPIAIDYSILPVAAGGPNDRVSDVNCFWMARDPLAPNGSVFARPRSGAFQDYDDLQTYYAGIGGNGNTTSRFRRYVGARGNRPLLPQHDLRTPDVLLRPNQPLHLRLIADGSHVALLRDGVALFELEDPAPYRSGYFGLRTTQSHLQMRTFRVWKLAPD